MSKLPVLLIAGLCAAAGTAAADPALTTTVFVGTVDGRYATSTLVAGATQAILIDTQLDPAGAHRVAAMILDSKKTLTTVYVSDAHPDHYFGMVVLRQVFPKAKFVALPAVVAEIKATWRANVAQWRPSFGARLPRHPELPVALTATTLTLDGQTLELHGPRQGDTAASTYVWIPSIKTVVAGDLVYRGIHPWTAQTNVDQRSAWVATLDELRALTPTTVIAGHRDPRVNDDVGAMVGTRDYLVEFDAALRSSTTAAETEQKVKTRFPAFLLDTSLKTGVAAQFPLVPLAAN